MQSTDLRKRNHSASIKKLDLSRDRCVAI